MTPHEIEVKAHSNHLKMKEVCERAGIAFSTFWRWKNGKKISHENYERLVRAASLLPQVDAVK